MGRGVKMAKSRLELQKSVDFKMARCCGTCEHSGMIGHDRTTRCSKLKELSKTDHNFVVRVEYICKHHKKKTGGK